MKAKILTLAVLLLLLFSASALAAPEKPSVSADESTYSEETGRYHMTGNVVVTTKDRTTRMDEAEVSATELEIWGDGNVRLTQEKDDLTCTADAVYLEGFGPSATLFGRVVMQRPGLIVRAESAVCDWQNGLITFRGAVIAIEKGKERIAETLVYDISQGELLT